MRTSSPIPPHLVLLFGALGVMGALGSCSKGTDTEPGTHPKADTGVGTGGPLPPEASCEVAQSGTATVA